MKPRTLLIILLVDALLAYVLWRLWQGPQTIPAGEPQLETVYEDPLWDRARGDRPRGGWSYGP